jgi:hypothetical protein
VTRELPVPADLTYSSFEWAVSKLKRFSKGDQYILKVSSSDYVRSVEIKVILVHKKKFNQADLDIKIMWGYEDYEWSLHLMRNGEEVDSIHTEGA